ncbi:uncharacterized protein LOC116303758 isoform X3 [Actinia tenebrosa]|uniref:Uncharacterized protein LOC116303758 isoform X3 n=1 Tax=Actinia tenebrosa TaxID=6105 RepID=A0A6P8IQL7_ACTTE|nr:uncharacterized protein LOC116303758 isoform X3 [Actinia tenebrosa]
MMESCCSMSLLLYIAIISVCLPQPSFFTVLADPDHSACNFKRCSCQDTSISCQGNLGEKELKNIPKDTENIIFQDGLNCDCETVKLVEWASDKRITIDGKCNEPAHLAGQPVNEINKEQLKCGHTHVRKRRSIIENETLNFTDTKPTGPDGLPLWPCDFEENFCQWFQLSDSDFKWTRQNGSTKSHFTGPNGDHTFGNGTYIYIETSVPKQLNDKTRLVSPTLRPVKANQTCNMTFYVHMYGNNIGQLNIYQAPVIGHDTLKKFFKTSQGDAWLKEEVTFDSNEEFQIIFEGVRGNGYQGDIALDDISFSTGCQRLVPGYVRLRSADPKAFNTGVVDIYNNGSWGQVCRDGWTSADASVACRELGFDSVKQISAVSTNGLSITGLTSLNCTGTETSVNKCPRSAWSKATLCTSNQTASLGCTGIAPVCPLKTHMYCPKKPGEPTAKCISLGQRCDFIDDCWDGSDERDCNNYTRCTFEEADFCGWLQAVNDHMNWTRHRGSTPTQSTGPSQDHNGDASKYYIYINVAGRAAEKAKIAVTPRFQGNHQGLCKVRFFYHMYGWGTGSLRVLITDQYTVRTLWQKKGRLGDQWNRAEVTLLNTSKSFQVVFEAEHTGYVSQGDIAIDDVSFTPECLPAKHENISCSPSTFKCSSLECISLEDRCDFKMDCFDGTDERNCGFNTPGRCNFEGNFCDWNNETDDKFDFERHQGSTVSFGTGPSYDHTLGYGQRGFYAYIESSHPRKNGDKARLVGPQFMWKNITGCKIRFFYHMWSIRYNVVGTLKVMLRNPITRETVTIWQKFGSQDNKWILADVPIATNWSIAEVVIEATRGQSYLSDIAIDDISFTPQCYPPIPSHVDKNYDVRLVGSKSSYQGRVEVFRVGYWGTVCNDGWDKNDAQVVCRQLGYAGAMNVFPSFGSGKGQIWLDDIKCIGNESNLNMCGHNGWSNHNCDHSKDATAVCDISGGTTAPIRLTGHTNDTHGGRVEVHYHNKWGSICFDEWDLHDAHVVCRQAGFLGVEKVMSEPSESTGHIWLSKVKCEGNENSLDKCQHSDWSVVSSCSHGYAGVVCKRSGASEGDIRLTGGRSQKEGRLEIFHRGEWGTVCEDYWSKEDAKVVCNELGFTSVVKVYQSFGPGTGQVWLHNLQCYGNETSLTQCRHGRWATSPCSHDEDVGLICGDNSYIGCYKDNDPRVMSHKSTMKDLTPVRCLQYCQSKGYSYLGLEWSTECYCGNHYDKYGNASASECSSPCAGDPSKTCGGPWRLSVYTTNPAILPSSAPGYLPVRQSCSSVSYIRNYGFLSSLASPNYFSGDHQSGYIWSPLYPSNYPNKIHCVWVLNLMPGSKARIEFIDFQTEKDFDYLEVRDGKRIYNQPLTPRFGFSGNKSSILTASSNTMWIKFYADISINAKGFKLRYVSSGLSMSTTPATTLTTPTLSPSSLPIIQNVIGGCNGVLDAVNTTFGYYDYYHDTGFIRSPGYPTQLYGNNLQCQWSVFVQQGYKIIMKVTDMDLHASSNDNLVIDDGHHTERSTGRSLPWSFQSTDRFLRVYFSTDSSGQAKGFMMKYERDGNGSGGNYDKRSANDKGMSGGSIAGIVVGFIVLILIIIILVLILLKNKKKRRNPQARHCFINEAYDNTDGMVMANAGAMAPHGLQDNTIFYASAAVAPPPYTPEAAANDPTPGYTVPTPTAPSEQVYSNLYSRPPPYNQYNDADSNSTTTGIGSVTNLRAAANDGQQAVEATAFPPLSGVLPGNGLPSVDGDTAFVKSVLPPIGIPAQDTKTPLPDDQAGPLPEKPPLTVVPVTNNNHPPARPNGLAPLEGINRCPASVAFGAEVPFEFICPISNEIMKRPVSASDGYTYDRRAIKSWFRQNRTSPMTNEPITDFTLRANEHLEARIKEFVRAHSRA